MNCENNQPTSEKFFELKKQAGSIREQIQAARAVVQAAPPSEKASLRVKVHELQAQLANVRVEIQSERAKPAPTPLPEVTPTPTSPIPQNETFLALKEKAQALRGEIQALQAIVQATEKGPSLPPLRQKLQALRAELAATRTQIQSEKQALQQAKKAASGQTPNVEVQTPTPTVEVQPPTPTVEVQTPGETPQVEPEVATPTPSAPPQNATFLALREKAQALRAEIQATRALVQVTEKGPSLPPLRQKMQALRAELAATRTQIQSEKQALQQAKKAVCGQTPNVEVASTPAPINAQKETLFVLRQQAQQLRQQMQQLRPVIQATDRKEVAPLRAQMQDLRAQFVAIRQQIQLERPCQRPLAVKAMDADQLHNECIRLENRLNKVRSALKESPAPVPPKENPANGCQGKKGKMGLMKLRMIPDAAAPKQQNPDIVPQLVAERQAIFAELAQVKAEILTARAPLFVLQQRRVSLKQNLLAKTAEIRHAKGRPVVQPQFGFPHPGTAPAPHHGRAHTPGPRPGPWFRVHAHCQARPHWNPHWKQADCAHFC